MQKLIIHQFKMLRDVEMEIPRFLVLIGDQATGKSTIAKLIYYFKNFGEAYSTAVTLLFEKNIPITEYFIGIELEREFSSIFGPTLELPSFDVEYVWGNGKKVRLTKGWGDRSIKISLEPSSLYDEVAQKTASIVGEYPHIRKGIDRPNIEMVGRCRREVSELMADFTGSTPNALFIPANRAVAVMYGLDPRRNGHTMIPHLHGNDEELMFRFLEYTEVLFNLFKMTFAEFAEASTNQRIDKEALVQLCAKVKRIMKGDYENTGGGEEIHEKDYQGCSHAQDFFGLSSGQLAVIRILQDSFLAIVKGESVFRVIEHPEAQLFPTAQKCLLEILACVVSYTDSQLVLITHSPYILSAINNLAFTHKAYQDGNRDGMPPFFLNPSEMGVYSVEGSKCCPLLDPKTSLIDQNALDTVSEELADEFATLFEVYKARRQRG